MEIMMRRGLVRRLVFLFIISAGVLLFVLFQLVLGPHPVNSLSHGRGNGRRRNHDSVVGMVVDDRIPTELLNCSFFQSYLRRLGKLNVSGSIETSNERNNTIKATHRNVIASSFNVTGENSEIRSANSPGKLKTGKYLSEPVDPHTYGYIHNPTRTCFHENGSKAGIYLLFFVPTAPSNFDQREAIRRSYGNATTWPIIDGAGAKTVFMLGTNTDDYVQEHINKEAAAYGDIVQEQFVDSYLNLTRKTVMGMKWVTSFCRHALYVMKIDDDTTVNLHRIVEIVKNAPHLNFSVGHVFTDPIVDRNPKSKFYVSEKYYPADKFPSYINGVGYIMSADLVESVYHTAVALPLFPWEDTFVGMCLQELEVEPRHDKEFLFWKSPKNIALKKSRCPTANAIFTNLSKDYVWQVFDACRK